MSTFRASSRRNGRTACERIAAQVQRAAEEMGFETAIEESRLSASRYVVVYLDDDGDELVKIRVSDHANRNGEADYEVGCDDLAIEQMVGDHWTWPILSLSERTGTPVPARIRRLAEKAGVVEAAAARAEVEEKILQMRRMEEA